MAETQVGLITRYFGKIGVAAAKVVNGELKVGDRIRIKGSTTDIEQMVESMQLDGDAVTEALPGQEVGIKVADKVRTGDGVFIVEE
jgi:putative protease